MTRPRIVQAGAPLDLRGAAGAPFTITLDVDVDPDNVVLSGWAVVAPVAPTVTYVAGRVTVEWSGEQTAEMASRSERWALTCLVGGEGPHPVIAGSVWMAPITRPGEATSVEADLAVSIGPSADLSISVTLGGGSGGGGGGRVDEIVAGAGIAVDASDPVRPVVSATGGGGGGGRVDEIVAGAGITVDDSDPTAPVVGVSPGSFATPAQGALADSAVQPGDLAAVATTGDYTDLDNRPVLGDAAARNVGMTAGTVAAGDDPRFSGGGGLVNEVVAGDAITVDASDPTAPVVGVTPGSFDPAGSAAAVAGDLVDHEALTTTAHGGIVADTDPRLSDPRTPTEHGNEAHTSDYVDAAGAAAAAPVQSVQGQTGEVVLSAGDVGAATAAQGALAESAVQPDDLADVATSGAFGDLSGTPTLGTAAAADVDDFASAAQGAKADSAVQPGDLAEVATSGDYQDLINRPTLGGAASRDVGTTAGTVAAGDDSRFTASVPRDSGIVVVDSPTPVARPSAAIVLWLDDATNAVAGDWRPA